MAGISPSQDAWRTYIMERYGYLPPNEPPINPIYRRSIMAQVIKLPARSNAIDYDEDTILDVYDSLVGDDAAAKGEGVVIDDAQDSESKARVRCRTMARLLKDGREPDADKYGDEDEGRDSIECRTHVIEQDGAWLPVLSLKG